MGTPEDPVAARVRDALAHYASTQTLTGLPAVPDEPAPVSAPPPPARGRKPLLGLALVTAVLLTLTASGAPRNPTAGGFLTGSADAAAPGPAQPGDPGAGPTETNRPTLRSPDGGSPAPTPPSSPSVSFPPAPTSQGPSSQGPSLPAPRPTATQPTQSQPAGPQPSVRPQPTGGSRGPLPSAAPPPQPSAPPSAPTTVPSKPPAPTPSSANLVVQLRRTNCLVVACDRGQVIVSGGQGSSITCRLKTQGLGGRSYGPTTVALSQGRGTATLAGRVALLDLQGLSAWATCADRSSVKALWLTIPRL